ncbi:MAG: leucine-rich repeat domain-containing protein, partial [Bacteroidales bacterium]|nr:leucine-rich repeat domain-containing protein [Bacteroidales bacterium]
MNVTKFNLPPTVINVGVSAFQGCTSLTELPDLTNVRTLKSSAFSGCTSLSGEVILPSNIRVLGNTIFDNCTGITSVLYNCSDASLDSPSSSSSPLAGLTNLQVLEIGREVNTLPQYAFANCSMRHLVYSANVGATSDLFIDNNNLKVLTISANVSSLPNNIFSALSILDSVSIRYNAAPITFNSNTFRAGAVATVIGVPQQVYSSYKGNSSWVDKTLPRNDSIVSTSNDIQFTISLSSSNNAWGTVSGATTTASEHSTTGYAINATPAQGCRFGGWSDGVKNASRTVYAMRDVSLTAFFVQDTIKGIVDTGCRDGVNYINDTIIYSTLDEQVVEINVSVLDVTRDSAMDIMCEAEYNWRDKVLTEAGTYNDTVVMTGNKCDSIFTIQLFPCGTFFTVENSTTQSVCDSFYWDVTGQKYYTSGPYINYDTNMGTHVVTIDTLNLTVNHGSTYTDIYDACDTFVWVAGNGETYTANNATDTVHRINQYGCDSLVTLNVAVRHSTMGTAIYDVCDTFVWVSGNGNTYTENNSTDTIHLTNVANCDSIITLNLTVRNSTNGVEAYTACDTFTWVSGNGLTYTASNSTDTIHGTNAAGCDSIITLNLTLNRSNSYTDVQTVCDSFVWVNGNGETFTSSTTEPQPEHKLLRYDNGVNGSGLGIGGDNGFFMWATKYEADQFASHRQIDSVYIYGNANTSAVYYICQGANASNSTVLYSESVNIVSSQWNSYAVSTPITLDNTLPLWIIFKAHHPTNQSVATAYSGSVYNAAWYSEDSVYWRNIVGEGYNYNFLMRASMTGLSNSTDTVHRTNAAGCDSVVTLSLTVHYSNTSADIFDVCDTFVWADGNGQTYTADNITDTVHRTNQYGCDSTATLNLTVRYSTTYADVYDVCDTFVWTSGNGNTYTESNNTDTIHLTNAIGCDSIITLNLTVRKSTSAVDSNTACNNFTWTAGNGSTYNVSNNTDTVHRVNAVGCDSIVTLGLTVNYSNTGTAVFDVCDTFTWVDGNGHFYTASNNIDALHRTNVGGCDSLVSLDLTIRYSSASTDSLVVCDSLAWIDGITYTESTDTTTFTLTNAVGCDSIVSLDLTVNHNSSTGFTMEVCDSVTWTNHDSVNVYTASGTYYNSYNTAEGCASVDTLYLTVNYSNTYADVYDVCDSMVWTSGNGQSYTASNSTDTVHRTNAAGCDSLVTLNLTVRYSTQDTDTYNVCDSMVWTAGNGLTYIASNNTDTVHRTNAVGCDSLVTLNLTVSYSNTGVDSLTTCDTLTWIDGITYSASTDTATFTVTNAAGCDSVVTLKLTVRYSTQDTDVYDVCDSMAWIAGNGLTYTASNSTDTVHRTNAAGCDSLVTLNLTVRYSTQDTDVYDVCDSMVWIAGNGSTYTASNSTDTVHRTNAAGCDSL